MTTFLYVHRCHRCGKPVVPQPTSIEITDAITIICDGCTEKTIGFPVYKGGGKEK